MLTLSPDAEALVRVKAASAGKTPDQLIREAFGGAAASGKHIDRARLAALLRELDALQLRDPRSEKEITDEGWGL